MFPIFASFIVLALWLKYEIHKHSKLDKLSEQSFWDKEEKANSTRRQSLKDLAYITIPENLIKSELLSDDSYVSEYVETISSLSKEKIVNLTGISNTDLKLTYGAPNLPLLISYDQNYTLLVRTLQKLAEKYKAAGYLEEAVNILEFAVDTHTDVSSTYHMLMDYYIEVGTPEKISHLIEIAQSLNSLSKDVIVRTLQESDSDTDLLRFS